MFGLPLRCTVFIQNILLVDAVFSPVVVILRVGSGGGGGGILLFVASSVMLFVAEIDCKCQL